MTYRVFSFDRDQTVNVNGGPVPLAWVRHLAHQTRHKVWAHGNYLLRDEADIPHVESLYDGTREDRASRVEPLATQHPDATAYIVIDDADVSRVDTWPKWTYYTPDDFVNTWKDRLGHIR